MYSDARIAFDLIGPLMTIVFAERQRLQAINAGGGKPCWHGMPSDCGQCLRPAG